MSLSEILASIPHRPPMLLIDEIVERGEGYLVCKKTFASEEFFFQGHYPGQPIVPGVILCEAAMQTGAVLLSKLVSTDGGIPVAARLNDVKFKKMLRPGDSILIESRLTERVRDAFFLAGKITHEGKVAVTLNFAVTIARAI